MKRLARPSGFDAVIFDLDGVVTDSARVHAVAWKALFDEYLLARASLDGYEFRPFSIEADYLSYVDGKPRYRGVRSFLESRGILLEEGLPTDPPETETVCGLGNRKDRLFTRTLEREGVRVFEPTVRLIQELASLGIRRGVATSSRNCALLLEIAGIERLFEARVDGVLSAEMGLKGKPDPDIFLKCAELLGVVPERTVVVEDAVSGVRAARAGGFALVVGLDNGSASETLYKNGADVVVPSFADVRSSLLDSWCRKRRLSLV